MQASLYLGLDWSTPVGTANTDKVPRLKCLQGTSIQRLDMHMYSILRETPMRQRNDLPVTSARLWYCSTKLSHKQAKKYMDQISSKSAGKLCSKGSYQGSVIRLESLID